MWHSIQVGKSPVVGMILVGYFEIGIAVMLC